MVIAVVLVSLTNLKDFHLKNLMISIGPPPSTISEIAKREAGKPRKAKQYHVFKNRRTGLENRIYYSEPISCLKPGELFSVKDIRLKVADFGHGYSPNCSRLTDSLSY
jgi:hypothetical protein